jgi:hypothetical protein
LQRRAPTGGEAVGEEVLECFEDELKVFGRAKFAQVPQERILLRRNVTKYHSFIFFLEHSSLSLFLFAV